MLEANTTYMYTYRHVYLDGHVSKTTEPLVIRTNNTNRKASLSMMVDYDLNSASGNLKHAKIELYRKSGAGDFRLIERIDPDDPTYTIVESGGERYITFIDDGKVSGGKFIDLITTSTKSHQTQTEVQDRLVKGNVQYVNRDGNELPYDLNISLIKHDEGQDNVGLPSNSNLQLYAKLIYDDGESSFHFPISNQVTTTGKDQSIAVGYTSGDFSGANALDNFGLKEVGLFLKLDDSDYDYTQNKITFGSMEINNKNVQTLSSSNTETPYNNANPRICLGYKYFLRVAFQQVSGNSRTPYHFIIDLVHDKDLSTSNDGWFVVNSYSYDYNSGLPTTDYNNVKSIFGENQDYSLNQILGTYTFQEDEVDHPNPDVTHNTHVTFSVYKLSYIDALKEAIGSDTVKLKMSKTNISSLSSSRKDSDFIETEVDVIGIEDQTTDEDFIKNGAITFPDSSRVYITLDKDSIYNDIDNISSTDTTLIDNLDDLKIIPYDTYFKQFQATINKDINNENKFIFELLGVDYTINTSIVDPVNLPAETVTIPLIASPPSTSFTPLQLPSLLSDVNTYIPNNNEFEKESLIYIGSYHDESSFLNNIIDFADQHKLRYSGFRFEKSSTYSRIVSDNNVVYESPIQESDLELLKDNFPYQIVWSEKSTEGTRKSGARTFLYTSYLDIGSEYGQIVDLRAFGNDLLVFCERGVGIVKVGAELASTPTNDIYVNSATFLNNPQWVLKNIPKIQKDSIVEHANVIYFCDGRDFWAYSGQFQNISEGAIEVSGDVVGGYDPDNDEYRATIVGSGNTFAYSTDLREWMGPYTYEAQKNLSAGNEFISIIADEFVEQNNGDQFGLDQIVTIVEGTANDIEHPHMVKKIRKFYLDIEGTNVSPSDTQFTYSSELDTNPETVNLGDKTKRNGQYRIGFKSDTGRSYNTRYVRWKITTVVEDFLLRSIAIDYLYKRR